MFPLTKINKGKLFEPEGVSLNWNKQKGPFRDISRFFGIEIGNEPNHLFSSRIFSAPIFISRDSKRKKSPKMLIFISFSSFWTEIYWGKVTYFGQNLLQEIIRFSGSILKCMILNNRGHGQLASPFPMVKINKKVATEKMTSV